MSDEKTLSEILVEKVENFRNSQTEIFKKAVIECKAALVVMCYESAEAGWRFLHVSSDSEQGKRIASLFLAATEFVKKVQPDKPEEQISSIIAELLQIGVTFCFGLDEQGLLDFSKEKGIRFFW